MVLLAKHLCSRPKSGQPGQHFTENLANLTKIWSKIWPIWPKSAQIDRFCEYLSMILLARTAQISSNRQVLWGFIRDFLTRSPNQLPSGPNYDILWSTVRCKIDNCKFVAFLHQFWGAKNSGQAWPDLGQLFRVEGGSFFVFFVCFFVKVKMRAALYSEKLAKIKKLLFLFLGCLLPSQIK